MLRRECWDPTRMLQPYTLMTVASALGSFLGSCGRSRHFAAKHRLAAPLALAVRTCPKPLSVHAIPLPRRARQSQASLRPRSLHMRPLLRASLQHRALNAQLASVCPYDLAPSTRAPAPVRPCDPAPSTRAPPPLCVHMTPLP